MTLFVFIILFLSRKTNNKKLKYVLIIVSFSILFFVSALRVNVGTDYKSYTSWFKLVLPNDYWFTLIRDIGFNYFIIAIKYFTKDPQWLFIITSFIILFFTFKACIKHQKYYELSIFLFVTLIFYFSSMNGIRQWIAVSIMMWAFHFVLHGKLRYYYIFAVISILFHPTSFIFLFVPLLNYIKISNVKRLVIIFVFFILIKLVNITGIVMSIVKIVLPSYYEKFSVMLNNYHGGYFYFFLSFIIFFIYVTYEFAFKKIFAEKEYTLKVNLSLILVMFSILGTVNMVFERLSLYFIPFSILLLPDLILVAEDNKKKKIIFYLLILFASFAYMVKVLGFSNANSVLPYTSIFN